MFDAVHAGDRYSVYGLYSNLFPVYSPQHPLYRLAADKPSVNGHDHGYIPYLPSTSVYPPAFRLSDRRYLGEVSAISGNGKVIAISIDNYKNFTETYTESDIRGKVVHIYEWGIDARKPNANPETGRDTGTSIPQPRWLIITYQLRLIHPDMDSGEISPYLDEAFTIERPYTVRVIASKLSHDGKRLVIAYSATTEVDGEERTSTNY